MSSTSDLMTYAMMPRGVAGADIYRLDRQS
jgi:hypothetical protein